MQVPLFWHGSSQIGTVQNSPSYPVPLQLHTSGAMQSPGPHPIGALHIAKVSLE